MAYPLFQLEERLRLCAAFVRDGARLADIGSDHAYLPIWLSKQGKIAHAIAADVRSGPLEQAKKNIARYEVADRVEARLSDGLCRVTPQEADDIVVAGMGGELIARIIKECDWLQTKSKRLILQPMTSAAELRLFLAGHGFALQAEQAIKEGARVYSVMYCRYAPERVSVSRLYPQIGLLSGNTKAEQEYIQKRMIHLQKQAKGLSIQGDFERQRELEQIIMQLEELLQNSGSANHSHLSCETQRR